MSRKFFNLCLYNFKNVNMKIIYIFISLIVITSLYTAMTHTSPFIKDYNMWNFYIIIFSYNILELLLMLFLGLFFIFHCFENKNESMYLKIRAGNFATWFSSKVVSVFLFNFISIIILTISTLIIGCIFFGFGLDWSNFSKSYDLQYVVFYSPMKIVIIHILTYSFFVTFLGEIIGLLIILIDKKVFVAIITVAYLILSTMLKSLKYISFENYMSLSLRYYILGQNPNNYMSVSEGIIIPIALTIFTALILISVYLFKKFFRED